MKKIWDGLPVFNQETIYHVHTGMRQSLSIMRLEGFFNMQAQPHRDKALCMKFHLVPYIIWANREGSGETAQMRRLAWAFAVHLW